MSCSIGDGLTGFANDVTFDLPDRIDRWMGREPTADPLFESPVPTRCRPPCPKRTLIRLDGTLTYDATGEHVSYKAGLTHSYDGDRLRGKKSESGVATYYLRSSVLGGQIVAEINASGVWQRGYVYLGGQVLAIQSSGAVSWVHQEPYSKGQRVTNNTGAITSTVEVDPFGGETNRSVNSAFQTKKYTSYIRDADGGDEAMHRRYNLTWSRFSQPDPYDGSYDASDPQSFNRYSYVGNDPVNFVDPSGLTYQVCSAEFSGTACMGQGFWGGGVSGGNGWGYDPRPGLRETRQDEMELHPISRVINDQRDDLYGFSSLFAGYSWFFGYSLQQKQPCPTVPLTPPGVSLDSNIRRAEQHRPNGAVFAYDDAKWFKSIALRVTKI